MKKAGFTLMLALLVIFITAQAAVSDSFVDDSTIAALENFEFGQPVSVAKKSVRIKGNESSLLKKGDSIIDDSTVAALENFKIGQTDSVAKKPVGMKGDDVSLLDKGDSIIDDSIVEVLEKFELVRTASDDNININKAGTEVLNDGLTAENNAVKTGNGDVVIETTN